MVIANRLASSFTHATRRAMSTTSTGGRGQSGGSSLATFVKFVFVPGCLAGVAYYYYNYGYSSPHGKRLLNPTPALEKDKFVAFTLKEIIPVNHNTKKFRFVLPDGTTELGLPTASAVVTKFVKGQKADGSPINVIRPYTPLEDPADGYTGHFDLLVKHYPNGPMSTHIHSLKPGDTLDIKGPIPKWPYKENEFQKIGMIAGGTGITPMVQLIQRILSNPSDKTKMTLLFGNIAEEDILMKDYFDSLKAKYPDRLEVVYTLEKPPKGWTGPTGYIGDKQLKEHLPKPGEGKVFICGPNPMLASISGTKTPEFKQGEVSGILKKLGYTENDVFKF
ncbi:NADH-cytochrome b5 reductase [Borealophlyctis nickersoniae]|nr:NADH-cytochrome b5 reductase [Borealophlyctis nickersoniae]